MSSKDPIDIGLIGCGNISGAYLQRAPEFEAIRLTACADADGERAQAAAADYGVAAMSPEALLADPEISLVINLTPPLAHAEVGHQILAAGKHLYSEKPLAATAAEARGLLEAANSAGLKVGCAPDTFLGGGHQHARKLVDDGAIGRPIGGTVRFQSHGMEHWHPNPSFFFKPGGGPLLDIGPYYLTAMINLLGPIKTVTAIATRGFDERIVTSEPRRGERIAVEVPTHVEGVLVFAGGAIVSLSCSWDVWPFDRHRLELFGTDGSMQMPDPNFFGGAIRLTRDGTEVEVLEPTGFAYSAPNHKTGSGASVANYRIIGVVDMAEAIRDDRPHRADGALAHHVLEVLEGLLRSSEEGRRIAINSTCERPAPMARAG